MHYNTTNEKGETLEGYQKQTASQNNRIACFFEANPGEIYTPWEVQSLVFYATTTPITSIRRSMSDLTKAGILTKTEHRKEAGHYDRRSYAWTINERYRETLGIMQEIFDPEPRLFNVAPLEPVNCKVCGKLLTAPYSIKMGIGPICQEKCMTEVLKKEKYEQ